MSFAYGFDPIESVAVAAGGARAQLMVKGAPADAVLRSSDESILTFTRGDDTNGRSFFVYGGEPGRADAILVDGAENELDRVTLEVGRVERLGVGITSLPVRVLQGESVAFRVDFTGQKKLIGDAAIQFAPSELMKPSLAFPNWPSVEAQAPGAERLVVTVDRASYEVPFEIVSPTAITHIDVQAQKSFGGTVILSAQASDEKGPVWGSRCEWTFSPPEAAAVKATYVPSALNINDLGAQTTIVMDRPLPTTCTIGGRTAMVDLQP